MKKLLIVSTLALAASASFAGEFALSGGGDIMSKYVYRGESLSGDKPSVGVNVRATLLDPATSFKSFVGVQANTMDKTSTGVARFEGGLGMTMLGTEVELGLRKSAFLGDNNPLENTREVFVRGAMPLMVTKGVLSAEYNRSFGPVQDAYTSVGYTQFVTPDIAVGVKAGWKTYDVAGVTKFNDAQVNASFKVAPNVSLVAAHSFGGKYVNGASVADQSFAGINVAF